MADTGRYVYNCYLYKVYKRINWTFSMFSNHMFQMSDNVCISCMPTYPHMCMPADMPTCLHIHTYPYINFGENWFDNFLKFWELREMSNEEEDNPPHPTHSHWSWNAYIWMRLVTLQILWFTIYQHLQWLVIHKNWLLTPKGEMWRPYVQKTCAFLPIAFKYFVVSCFLCCLCKFSFQAP